MNNISTSIQGEVIIEIVNTVKVTYTEVGELKVKLNKEINSGWRNIIVDISNCRFVDSSFWGLMVLALRDMQKVGRELRIVVGKDFGDNLFKVSGILNKFEFYNSVSDALASLKENIKIKISELNISRQIKYCNEPAFQ